MSKNNKQQQQQLSKRPSLFSFGDSDEDEKKNDNDETIASISNFQSTKDKPKQKKRKREKIISSSSEEEEEEEYLKKRKSNNKDPMNDKLVHEFVDIRKSTQLNGDNLIKIMEAENDKSSESKIKDIKESLLSKEERLHQGDQRLYGQEYEKERNTFKKQKEIEFDEKSRKNREELSDSEEEERLIKERIKFANTRGKEFSKKRRKNINQEDDLSKNNALLVGEDSAIIETLDDQIKSRKENEEIMNTKKKNPLKEIEDQFHREFKAIDPLPPVIVESKNTVNVNNNNSKESDKSSTISQKQSQPIGTTKFFQLTQTEKERFDRNQSTLALSKDLERFNESLMNLDFTRYDMDYLMTRLTRGERKLKAWIPKRQIDFLNKIDNQLITLTRENILAYARTKRPGEFNCVGENECQGMKRPHGSTPCILTEFFSIEDLKKKVLSEENSNKKSSGNTSADTTTPTTGNSTKKVGRFCIFCILYLGGYSHTGYKRESSSSNISKYFPYKVETDKIGQYSSADCIQSASDENQALLGPLLAYVPKYWVQHPRPDGGFYFTDDGYLTIAESEGSYFP